ncbi:MAG: hypothetical protein ACLRPW_01630 [Intestinibacter sp.]
MPNMAMVDSDMMMNKLNICFWYRSLIKIEAYVSMHSRLYKWIGVTSY